MSLRTFISATGLAVFGGERNYLAHPRAFFDASIVARIALHFATMCALIALPGLKVTVRDIIRATSFNARHILATYVVERTRFDCGVLPAPYSGLKLATSVGLGIHARLRKATLAYPSVLTAKDVPETFITASPTLSPPDIIVTGQPPSSPLIPASPEIHTPHLSFESHTRNNAPCDLYTTDTPLASPESHSYTLAQPTGILPRTNSGHIHQDSTHLLPQPSKYLDVPVGHTAASPPGSRLTLPLPPSSSPTTLDLNLSRPSHDINHPQPSSLTISVDDQALDTPDRYEEHPTTITEPISGETFTLKGKLAQGGFGRVIYATTACGEIRAIKVINKARQVASYSGAINLSREQRVYIRITRSQPQRISPLLLLWSDDINTYFVQPLYPMTLHTRVLDIFYAGKLLTLQESKLYAAELLLALAELHALKLVHRDIKPSNILISESGHLVLADFGLCLDVNDRKSLGLAGTPGYQAPEVLQGEVHGYAADVWSLGMVFFQMFAGDPRTYFNHTGYNTRDLNDAVLNDPIELEAYFEDEYTHELVADMLYYDPSMRPTIEELFEYPFFTVDFDIAQVERGMYTHSYRPTINAPDFDSSSDIFCDESDMPYEQRLKTARLHKGLRYECDWWCEDSENLAGPSGSH